LEVILKNSSEIRPLPVNLPPLERRNLLTALEEAVAAVPDRVAVRDYNHAISYRALHARAVRLAGGLAGLGIARQQPVLVMLDNHVDFVLAVVGIGIGARIQVPVNTGYHGPILKHLLNNCAGAAIIVEAHYLPLLDEVANETPYLTTLIVRGTVPDDFDARGRHIIQFSDLDGEEESRTPVAPWDIMGVMYTSGTSGPSKGALVPHAQAYSYSAPLADGSEPEVAMVVLPLFHVAGQWGGVYRAFITKGTAVVLPKFSASSFWEQARAFGCTRAGLLGTLAQFLANQPESAGDRDHPLRRISMAPVIADLDGFMDRFGLTSCTTAYGSTEIGAVTYTPTGSARPGAAGWPRPGYELKLVDENDIEVAEGAIGEILARARDPWCITSGYLNMPEATLKSWRNLWFHTGDLGSFDADGQLVFHGRNNDAIRRRGENISAFEVEAQIEAHPLVAEAAVIRARSDHVDDEVMACVVLASDADLSGEALTAHLRDRLPAFMVPRYIDFMDELPKTPTGKIQKTLLRERGITPTTWDRLQVPVAPIGRSNDGPPGPPV
jgi:crotonobetaine/carnitine-CoA ligase